MIKIVTISDTHGQQIKNLPSADLLIHAGDFSTSGTFQDFNNFVIWMTKVRMSYRKIVCVPGNHDRWVQANQTLAKEVLTRLQIDLLIDEETYFEGFKIYGMPWTPEFMQWAFMGDKKKRKIHCEAIPIDTNILITHGAPKGHLDILGPGSSEPGTHAGCEFLKEAIVRIKPTLHTFGHLHDTSGIQMVDGTLFVNAASMTDTYRLVNGFKVIYL